MHGRVKREGERIVTSSERSISLHMHSAATPADLDSFLKDGRKICIGDCALFKLSDRSPPFIGLIRWLALNKESDLQLGVNWLYRSSELKLEKHTLVDSAPNEIFYSFRKNEIPASSLLHPCKVAFLPRGVELPIGTSSFVCRRAYDIAAKTLGWLTDQHYINDRQEEVDQLLNKTRTEMHVNLHSDGRSPKKQANGVTLTSQLKPASDSSQNSGSSFASQAKGKKRERGDHGSGSGSGSFKRERSSQLDDDDSVQCKTQSNLKCDIARITEKGRLVNLEGVEKLVQLMQLDRKDKKMDSVRRSMLASVMASTDNVDCLNHFLHLRGLPVLDEWLQDIHKGKIGDGNNIKDGDKSVDQFLLVLLRALDKLPVNLQTLQTCNIGRSVNHLRSHKNTDIQRKARTLVDTWKKRVEAEMISIDAKSGSTHAVSAWPLKSHLRDVASKSTTVQNSAAKTTSGRSSPGESGTKYEASSPGKDNETRTSPRGIADAPQTGEDMSSSSNQSHNNGQSFPMKDDLKSPTSGSVSVNKISSSTTRGRKISGFSGTSTGNHSRTSSPAHKSTALEKSSHSALADERVVETPEIEGSSHKLIVKIPNCARSPGRGVSRGSAEDPTIASNRVSSPVTLNKHEQSSHSLKDKNDASRPNVNDSNDVLTGSEGAESPAVSRDEAPSMTVEDSKKVDEGSPANPTNSANLHASFSPMNALIESCVKYSEANSSLSLDDDDVGMNLLATVAAGEMSRSDVVFVFPTDSTERSTPAIEELCTGDEAKSRSSCEDRPTGLQNKLYNGAECDGKKQAVLNRCYGEQKSHSSENMPYGEGNKHFSFSNMDLRSNEDPEEIIEKSDGRTCTADKSVFISTSVKIRDDESNGVCGEKSIFSKVSGIDVTVTEEKNSTDQLIIDEVAESTSLGEGLDRITISQQKLTGNIVESVISERYNNEKSHQNECGEKSESDGNGVKVEEPNQTDTKSCVSKSERHNLDKQVDRNAASEKNSTAVSCFTSRGLNSDLKEASLVKEELPEPISLNESRFLDSVDDKVADETDKRLVTGAGAIDTCKKNMFDLNECFGADDGNYGELLTSTSSGSTTVHVMSCIPTITVASATIRPFIPPGDLLRTKSELGWKGSAATSAFRPAEPRKVLETAIGTSYSPRTHTSTGKNNRFPLDIDLNVPDERVLEELASRGSTLAIESSTDFASNSATLPNETSTSYRGSGVLDLDLNLVDDEEEEDTGHCSTSRNRLGEAPPLMYIRALGSLHVQRDFDLNNGLAVDDATIIDPFSINQIELPSEAGFTMNNPGLRNFSSWFPPGNAYSTTSILTDRGEHSFPYFPPGASQKTFGPTDATPFNPIVYRGSVLSTSPAMPFPGSSFQFPVFPFGPHFPVPSATFSVGGTSYPDFSSGPRFSAPPVNSQYLGPLSSQFQRPYLVGLPNNGGFSSNRKWDNRQGLDLNTGPGTMESEAKDEIFPLSSGQHSVASLQAQAEEQAVLFSGSGGGFKRKEPEEGVDNELFRHKHSSWQ